MCFVLYVEDAVKLAILPAIGVTVLLAHAYSVEYNHISVKSFVMYKAECVSVHKLTLMKLPNVSQCV